MARTYYRSYINSATSTNTKMEIPDQLLLDMEEDLKGQKDKLDMLLAKTKTGDGTSTDPADTTALLSATMDGLLLLFGVSTVISNFQIASKLAPSIQKPKPKTKLLNMRDVSTQTDDSDDGPQLLPVPVGVAGVLEETEESSAQNQDEDKCDENSEIGTQTEIEATATDNEKCWSHTHCPCHCHNHNHYFSGSGSQDQSEEDDVDTKSTAPIDYVPPQSVTDHKMNSLAATLLSPHILSEINQAIMLGV